MSSSARPPRTPSTRETIHTALLVAGVVVAGLLVWQFADVLLLGFAAVLFAILLRTVAEPIERFTPISGRWSLAAAGLLVAAVIGGFFWVLGAQIYSQASDVFRQLPELVNGLGERIGVDNLHRRLFESAEDLSRRGDFVGRIVGFTSGLLAATASLLLVLIGGAYFSARPRLYREGALRLVPAHLRGEATRAVENIAQALRLWLLGQLVAMVLVGLLTTAGLYAIGIPSALALGVIAGIAEFVPIVGPVLGAVPAILLAVSEGGGAVLWVVALYVLVQQLESYLIMPLIQRKAVDLPPALTLFVVLAMGVLFGPLGVLLGTPLTVVVYVAVKQLYLQDALDQKTDIPGASQ